MFNTSASTPTPQYSWCSDAQTFRVAWSVGLCAAWCAVAVQGAVLAWLGRWRGRRARALLLHVSVARAVNATAEFCVAMHVARRAAAGWRAALFATLLHSDCALICFMCVFTAHLHARIMRPLATPYRLAPVAALIWTLSAPVGVLCPVLLRTRPAYFRVYYEAYYLAKVVPVTVNAVLLARVLCVARAAGGACAGRGRRPWSAVLRSACIACCLSLMTSAQVLVSDLAGAAGESLCAVYSLCVVNSFQPVMVLALVALLARGDLRAVVGHAARDIGLMMHRDTRGARHDRGRGSTGTATISTHGIRTDDA